MVAAWSMNLGGQSTPRASNSLIEAVFWSVSGIVMHSNRGRIDEKSPSWCKVGNLEIAPKSPTDPAFLLATESHVNRMPVSPALREDSAMALPLD